MLVSDVLVLLFQYQVDPVSPRRILRVSSETNLAAFNNSSSSGGSNNSSNSGNRSCSMQYSLVDDVYESQQQHLPPQHHQVQHRPFHRGRRAREVVGPAHYYFGIVDALQTWNWKKKGERFFKVAFIVVLVVVAVDDVVVLLLRVCIRILMVNLLYHRRSTPPASKQKFAASSHIHPCTLIYSNGHPTEPHINSGGSGR